MFKKQFLYNIYCSYHIPEVRIVTIEPLRVGKSCELLLKFINPTQHQTEITILPLFSVIQREKNVEAKAEDTEEAKSEEVCYFFNYTYNFVL